MRKLLAILLLVVIPLAASADDCGAPTAAADGWAIASPEAVGIDAAKLCGLDSFLEQWPKRNVHAVLAARHGKLVMERYFSGVDVHWSTDLGVVRFAPDVMHDVKSVSKSATSLLVGIALAEGKFPDLDSSVLDSFPELADLSTPEKARITFRHLLTMSSGFAWDENRPYTDPLNSEMGMLTAADPFRYIFSQPMQAAPGTLYNYNGGNTSLLAEVLVRRTGRSLHDYARDKLFTPLDVARFDWEGVGRSGKLGAYGSLRLTPRDMAKLGQLLLTGGRWNGQAVVPIGWVAESTKPRLMGQGLFFYGYQWWLGRSLVQGREVIYSAAFGIGGQRVYVIPEFDLVVAINAGHYDGSLQTIIPAAILDRLVLPAVKGI
jgi:CubicO group peptidase (beta-lactamase class C family)